MKKDSALSRLSAVREAIHEEDRKNFPDRHWLTKDSYDREDTMYMCPLCSEHYEWSKQLEYDARTNRFYKIKDKAHE